MKRTILTLTLLLAGVMAAFTAASAQQTVMDIPRLISYQGLITANDGRAVPDGNYRLSIAIYADEAGRTILWHDTYDASLVGGVFDLYLGSSTPLPGSDVLNRPLWVGVKVDGAEEMRPLTRLSSSPYAMNVPDKSILTSKLANGAVTAEKVDMNYISEIRINGEKVSGNGAVLNITSGRDVTLNYDRNNNTLAIEMTGSSSAGRDDDKSSSELLVGEYNPAPPGNFNWIVLPANFATISGGERDTIFINAHNATIAGGQLNKIQTSAVRSTISGGNANLITAQVSNGTIGGGESNTVSGAHGTVGGGRGNFVVGSHGAIPGGEANLVRVNHGAVGGGSGNSTLAQYGTIAGGQRNEVRGSHGTIGGGITNAAQATNSTVGGGRSNVVQADNGTIGGGGANRILPVGASSTIGGGESNQIDSNNYYATIGGGAGNYIAQHLGCATISGGCSNGVYQYGGTVGGGAGNSTGAAAYYGTVGGGVRNVVEANIGTISGGLSSYIDVGAEYAAVGGGYLHQITNGGYQGTIPGGNELIVQSWAQTAVGTLNIPSGFTPPNYGGGVPTDYDQPIFLVGNGFYDNAGNQIRSHAFEVSYSGHSTVFDINGSGGASGPGATGAKLGGTYQDNVIYAWAHASAEGRTYCDFGVRDITRLDVGRYIITINPIDRDGNSVVLDDCASITATVNSDQKPTWNPDEMRPICYYITASRLQGNQFNIMITYKESCEFVDQSFMFKVTARPK